MDIGFPELLIILIVVSLIFGPDRIAKAGRELGEGIRIFRRGLETPTESENPDEDKPAGG